jgi:hypothetical protein
MDAIAFALGWLIPLIHLLTAAGVTPRARARSVWVTPR